MRLAALLTALLLAAGAASAQDALDAAEALSRQDDPARVFDLEALVPIPSDGPAAAFRDEGDCEALPRYVVPLLALEQRVDDLGTAVPDPGGGADWTASQGWTVIRDDAAARCPGAPAVLLTAAYFHLPTCPRSHAATPSGKTFRASRY